MAIFGEVAHKFWEAGIPAHPTRGKAAFIPGWQRLADKLPSELEQAQWTDLYADCNIGIVLGSQSGLMVLDIDTDDERLVNAILAVIPASPWKRVGKKGMMLAYRYTGPTFRTFRIKDRNGNMMVECLAARVNIIVPPSIHPDTGSEYKENRPLYEIPRNEFAVLPRDIDAVLAGALREAGVSLATPGSFKVADWVPAGARDNALVSHAGVLSRSIMRGERTLLEGLSEMSHWVENFTEKVVGDSLSEDKARQKLLEFFIRDVSNSKKALPLGWDDGLSEEDKKKMGVDFDADATQWSYKQIMDYMQSEIVKNAEDPADHAVMLVIDKVLAKINRNPDLKPYEIETILKFISEQSAKTVSISSLRRQLTQMKKADIAGETHGDIAAALLADMEQFAPLRWWGGSFYRWCGSHWEVYDEDKFHKQIQQEFGDAPAAKRFSDHAGIVNALKKLCKEDLRRVSMKGLNFANGFLDEDLKMHDHDPDLGMTYCLPYLYEPAKAGHCPQFFQLLADAWGEDRDYEDKVQALREAIGATLMGLGPRFQRAICLIGVAGSGKSQIVDIVTKLLPEKAIAAVRPDDFGDRFMPVQLVGKVMNVCGEISESRNIAGDYFKQIIEGSTISVQQKGKDAFPYAPEATHWFLSNFQPKSKDTSDGFVRRWLFLQFNKKTPDDRKIQGLADDIAANEKEAIAAWAVQAVPDLIQRRSYTLPSSHEFLVEELANDLNTVRFFLTRPEVVRLGEKAHKDRTQISTTEKELHDAFWSFCAATEGVRPAGLKTFRKMLRGLQGELGFRVSTRRSPKTGFPETVYEYITLVDERSR